MQLFASRGRTHSLEGRLLFDAVMTGREAFVVFNDHDVTPRDADGATATEDDVLLADFCFRLTYIRLRVSTHKEYQSINQSLFFIVAKVIKTRSTKVPATEGSLGPRKVCT